MPKGVYTRTRKQDKDPARRYITERRRNLRKKFGITLEQYEDLLQNQNGVCLICEKEETSTYRGMVKSMAVDHDHKNGVVRGILCARCNKGLGLFKDNIALLKNSIIYLESYESALEEYSAINTR